MPLFFLVYATIRTKARLRNFLLLMLFIAAVNGVAGFVQLQLTPEEFANWGPGYNERIYGLGDVSGRAFVDDNGTLRTRPFGLGSDQGFGGAVGLLAIPAAIALIAMARRLDSCFWCRRSRS